MQGNREKYKEYIYSILMKNGSICKRLFNKHIKENNEISIKINNILKKYIISLRVFRYFIDNPDLKGFNIFCPNCGNRIDLSKEYKENCSKKCMYKNPKMKERRKETNLERYGVENTFQGDYFKEKIKQTNLKNLGIESPTKSLIIKEKIKKTNLERRGVETPFLMSDFQDKRKVTHFKKYGYDNCAKSPIIKEKTKNTCLKKFGETTNLKCKETKDKIKKTCLKKYGVENTGQVKEFKDKGRKTLMLNYRSKHYKDFLKHAELCNVEILTPYEEHLTSDLIKYKCKICNTIFDGEYKSILGVFNNNKIYCPKCTKHNLSIGENNLFEFVSSLIDKNNIIRNSFQVLDSKKQLDIYIPSKNLAIEYNGLYWHSTEFRDKNYHIEKTLECKNKNIRLIHVFENDWLNKQEIIKSIISSALGIYKEKIYARKCNIKELSNEQYKDFLNNNHIQGYCKTKIKLGLFYNNELVSCIGIGKSRYKKSEIELIRFCNKLNTKIPGALSKLIKYSGVKNLISYVDLKYFTGSGYEKCGFELLERTKPNYFYVNGVLNVLSREKCQKYKLPKLLGDKFDSNLTETENMLNNGYYKIYGCGNLKYQLKI